MVCAGELGLSDRIERLPAAAHPINRDLSIVAFNPLGQVPTFQTDDGEALYDSRVICEYLDALADGKRLIPTGQQRWRVLRDQALADGLLDAALAARYELTIRPNEYQWDEWLKCKYIRMNAALDSLDDHAGEIGDRVDLGTISIGCALGYLDFRFPDFGWRANRDQLAQWYEAFEMRPSMVATRPHS